MATSCAWRMITKLNVNPFQAVNSLPLVEPVQYTTTLRRPLGATSGGEKTDDDKNTRTMAAFTGHRIMFVDVLMNFVQRDVEASNGSAFGGRSYENRTHIGDVWETWTDIWHV